MKSDRRTLIVLVVFFVFLAISASFRSNFLYGARLLTGKITMNGLSLISVGDTSAPETVGDWSIVVPEQSGTTRDERLGLVLANMMKAGNAGFIEMDGAVGRLEDYCKANPTDMAAKAHLLRLAFNGSTIPDKAPNKEALITQAKRLLAIADQCSAKEPNNWYWRDRQLHLGFLLGYGDEAIKSFSTRPLPDRFDDYVLDEIKCKEALVHGQYFELPECTNFALWANTLFPHLSTFGQIQNLKFKDKKNGLKLTDQQALDLRAIEMLFGRDLVKSEKTAIAAMVGLNDIRLGLWNSRHVGRMTKEAERPEEQKRIEPTFKGFASSEAWNECLKLAKENFMPRFMRPDQDMTGLRVGQYGPPMVAAGVLCLLIGLGIYVLGIKTKKSISHPIWSWILLLSALIMQGLYWHTWNHLGFGSFANQPLGLAMIGLAVWCLIRLLREKGSPKIFSVCLLITALMFGMANTSWQAGSITFLLIYLMQRGKAGLSPWSTAVGVASVCYHTCLSLAYANMIFWPVVATAVLIGTIVVLADRNLDPDKPRIPTVSIGLGFVILGTFLFSLFNNAMILNMQEEQRIVEEVRAHFKTL